MSLSRALSRLTPLSFQLSRLHWDCYRNARAMAAAVWAVALGLCVVVWCIEYFALTPLRHERNSDAAAAATAAPIEATQGLSTDGTSVPSRVVMDALLLDMNRMREQAGLQWGAAGLTVRPLEAMTTEVASQDLGRQDIALSVSGRYAQVRRMVAELLNAYPTLALRSLDVRRDSHDKNKIEAQLQWLFVHRTSTNTNNATLTLPQQRAAVKTNATDPFALPVVVARTAPVRAAPLPPPVVEPPPSAPPLPFKFLGRVSGSTEAVFLSQGQRVWRVKAGDTLLDQYRVDALEEGAIRFTYLPLNQSQSLLLR